MDRRTFLKYFSFSGFTTIALPILGLCTTTLKKAIARSSNTQAIVFYVAPNGNDAWTGTQAQATGKNGPFATLTKVRDTIRQLKQQQGGLLQQPVTVFLRGGTYFLQAPLHFTAQDSGTKDCPISYKAYPQETPAISGGRILRGWRSIVLNGKTVWTTYLPEVKTGKWSFHQLWVNGKRAQRCRYPKTGFLKVAQAPDVNAKTPWQEGQTRFKFRAGDLQNWKQVETGEAIVITRWAESRLPIKAIDPASRMLSFHNRSIYRIDPGDSDSSAAGVYYLENIREFLTEPGEWYLDRPSGQLYYIPDRESNSRKPKSLRQFSRSSSTSQLRQAHL